MDIMSDRSIIAEDFTLSVLNRRESSSLPQETADVCDHMCVRPWVRPASLDAKEGL